MTKGLSFNNYTFQFILLVILNFAFGGILFLILKNFDLPVDPAEPLGAPDSFIIYNNIIKSLLTLVIFHFYKIYFHRIFTTKFFQYGLLAVFLFIGNGFVNFIMDATLKQTPDVLSIFWTPIGPTIFKMKMVFAALLVYHWSLIGEKRDFEFLRQKLEVASLRELKARAELEALQAKINPHFLYNSLNSVNSLIDQKPEKAKEMVILLSKLFRLSVNNKTEVLCTIKEELELVTTYLSIEKVRFGEKLQYTIDCDPSLMNVFIPKFLLQPLVENAIKHGISTLAEQGKIEINIRELGEFIEFKISDNGVPFATDFQQGYGLKSVNDKIRLLGGEGAAFEIINPGKIAGRREEKDSKRVVLNIRRRESIDH